jgi:membrane peptidoglycan carboxypeptidase
MLSEDGAFWWHKGFLLEPFKDSIIVNLREKRFVRGASTISMQLVKNLYLKRQKTIARKLEEMLITWMIEEKRLVSKERMYEIYLNIIEWGPGIYGATEAARFYFNKDVAKLTLAEAIFMASIVPRPKRFMVLFDEDQRLRPWLQAYYRDVSSKMFKREMIGQQEYDLLVPEVRLKGPARFLLKGNESMPDDQLWQSEEIVE